MRLDRVHSQLGVALVHRFRPVPIPGAHVNDVIQYGEKGREGVSSADQPLKVSERTYASCIGFRESVLSRVIQVKVCCAWRDEFACDLFLECHCHLSGRRA